MKNIIVRCGIYDCYWNIGSQFRRKGNCAANRIELNLDYSQCSKYIERGRAQAKLAQEENETILSSNKGG